MERRELLFYPQREPTLCLYSVLLLFILSQMGHFSDQKRIGIYITRPSLELPRLLRAIYILLSLILYLPAVRSCDTVTKLRCRGQCGYNTYAVLAIKYRTGTTCGAICSVLVRVIFVR